MKFEYKIIINDTKGIFSKKVNKLEIENDYNKYGKDGWELVSTSSNNDAGYTTQIIATFKRKLN
ncbi:MAG: hypothetical protein CMF96_01805 [Candidatus Marinimicrobia bacterium]|nr:hypothetical protein [Candidatus Neomarinimicrobiota bacterium]|tara:strand:+ start:305 stop:496 length:192 start_codon:yes stop_codon:yes gene_type:complete